MEYTKISQEQQQGDIKREDNLNVKFSRQIQSIHTARDHIHRIMLTGMQNTLP